MEDPLKWEIYIQGGIYPPNPLFHDGSPNRGKEEKRKWENEKMRK